ncbi:MAG TPA: hypothetical protein VLM85_09535 [Polyangiaceae bacterium]|nr:hypothetical protein [Polyangiaceae bacterium]
MTTLRDVLADRIGRASLQALAGADFLAADPVLLSALAGDPADAEACAADVLRALSGKNQFVASDPEVVRAVRGAMRALWEQLAAGEKRDRALLGAREALSAILGGALGKSPREVVSAEYSAELQLAVLGLDVATLAEPVLDIGCGEKAALVRHLRDAGKQAFGLDPLVPPELGDRGDWLAYDYGTARWGTIVSHLGFSLHFMHQEMRRSELAFEYARTYMRIVRALAPRGVLAYVPGLPFIEALLPAGAFAVTRAPLPESLRTEQVLAAQRDTGLVLEAATHVQRLR